MSPSLLSCLSFDLETYFAGGQRFFGPVLVADKEAALFIHRLGIGRDLPVALYDEHVLSGDKAALPVLIHDAARVTFCLRGSRAARSAVQVEEGPDHFRRQAAAAVLLLFLSERAPGNSFQVLREFSAGCVDVDADP